MIDHYQVRVGREYLNRLWTFDVTNWSSNIHKTMTPINKPQNIPLQLVFCFIVIKPNVFS